jgi:adenosylmethionine-8-amino-7-oxononanoate aminotransferase
MGRVSIAGHRSAMSDSRILHRRMGPRPPIAVSGKGVILRDSDGKEYIDASGGAAVSSLGHGHPDILAAMRKQMERLEYAHTSFFTTEVAEALADDLVRYAPDGLDRVYLISGGSEAMETALKLARQYFVEKGEPGRTKFVARLQSYHGNTLGALSVGGNLQRRAAFEPILFDVSHIEPCFAYRHKRDGESDEEYGRRAADALEAKLLEVGPETVIGFVAETVVGATAGAVAAAPGYFARIREICDRYGILLILDEVMSGMGRTGTLYACEQEGVSPDLLTCAKGLGGGYQPIGAALVSETIYDCIARGSGAFMHGLSYIGHPVACAAALAVQQVIRRDDLLDNVRRRGDELQSALEERFGNHPNVGDIRGRGLFRAVEFVADRTTKATFSPSKGLANRVHRAAMEEGLCVYPGSGTADGRNGDHVLIAPPFIVDGSILEEIVKRLGKAIDKSLS